MQKVKIKTSGIKAILKSIGYDTNIVINRIHRGYKTILVGLKDDSLIEIHLTKVYLDLIVISKLGFMI